MTATVLKTVAVLPRLSAYLREERISGHRMVAWFVVVHPRPSWMLSDCCTERQSSQTCGLQSQLPKFIGMCRCARTSENSDGGRLDCSPPSTYIHLRWGQSQDQSTSASFLNHACSCHGEAYCSLAPASRREEVIHIEERHTGTAAADGRAAVFAPDAAVSPREGDRVMPLAVLETDVTCQPL